MEPSGPSKHLWLGNLHPRLTRTALRSAFEVFGELEDVVTFPGRMYAFVNFKLIEDALQAVHYMHGRQVRTPRLAQCALPDEPSHVGNDMAKRLSGIGQS